MSNQLGLLRTRYPHSVLFPPNCDLSTKPPASCVPARSSGVLMLTSKRRTVDKSSDDGIIRPLSTASVATSQTNGTGISSAAIAGIIIGAFAFGLLTMFISYMFWRRRRIAKANSQAADQYPKAEGPNEGGMNYPTPWDSQGDQNTAVIPSPSPMRQKDRQYQTPPARHDDSSDANAYHSGGSASVIGTAFTSLSPPSYLAATSSNTGTR